MRTKKINFTTETSICESEAMNPRGEVKGQSHIISSLLSFVIHHSRHFHGLIGDEWQHRDVSISSQTEKDVKASKAI